MEKNERIKDLLLEESQLSRPDSLVYFRTKFGNCALKLENNLLVELYLEDSKLNSFQEIVFLALKKVSKGKKTEESLKIELREIENFLRVDNKTAVFEIGKEEDELFFGELKEELFSCCIAEEIRIKTTLKPLEISYLDQSIVKKTSLLMNLLKVHINPVFIHSLVPIRLVNVLEEKIVLEVSEVEWMKKVSLLSMEKVINYFLKLQNIKIVAE